MDNPALKGFLLYVLALLIWSPLRSYAETDITFFGIYFNWMPYLIGLGAFYLIIDFGNFQKGTKLRHYFIAALLCPFWPIARILMRPKKSQES